MKISKNNDYWPYIILMFRTISFYIIGFLFIGIFYFLNIEKPWQEITRWWTFQVIITNIICFFLLCYLQRKEGKRFIDLYRLNPEKWKKDILLIILLIIPSGIIGYYSVVIAGVLFYGNQPPEFMMQSLPIWAAIISLLLFPLSNALIETTTYFGYAFEKIAIKGFIIWIPVLLSVIFLALQHIGIPLYLDDKYVLYRIISFLPFALLVGIIYLKIRRLFPIIILHFLADLTLAIITLAMSIKT